MTWSCERGQSAAEVIVTFFVLTLLAFGAVHTALFVTARHTVNYAAFATARSAMVHGSLTHTRVRLAEREAMRSFPWPGASLDAPGRGVRGRRSGVVVRFHLPLGTLIYGDQPPRGIPVEGFAMTAIQPAIAEEGDNAR